MRPVAREEVLDYVTYGERRECLREKVLAVKAKRRIHVGRDLTFLFENHETILYQIQEMLLAEKIVREAEILHEIETYNEVGGPPGELGCVLLIELEDPAERDEKLRRWLDLPKHVYVKLEDGRHVGATYDPRQVGDTRLSSVQYLRFATGGEAPVAIGSDHLELTVETVLSDDQRRALGEDLKS